MWGNDNSGKNSGKKNDVAASSKPAKTVKPNSTVDTLVGRQSEITGDVRFAGGLHVDGKVKGKIMADSDKNAVLSISESGAVEGDIRVPHVVLNGLVEGDVHASQRITLSAKARVSGNVYYKLIEMTSGAMVNGQMVYDGEGADKVTSMPTTKKNPVEEIGEGKPNDSDRVASNQRKTTV